MLKEKEILIEFMKEKHRQLLNINPNAIPYITDKDERSIKYWANHKAQRVLDEMCIIVDSIEWANDNDICPFCIYVEIYENGLCGDCSYGKRHKICYDENSDYKNIINELPKQSIISSLDTTKLLAIITPSEEGEE